MEGFKQYIDQIQSVSLSAFSEVQNCFKPEILKKHEYFTTEGEYAQRIGYIEEGIIRAYVRTIDGKEYTKQFFRGPTLIGAYSSLLSKSPNKIIQQALTDCTLWTADYRDIENLYDKHHELERLGRKMAEVYYLQKEQLLVEMALYDATKRYDILKQRFPYLETQIPQYHIASYLGISPTQLSRIRMKMVEQNT